MKHFLILVIVVLLAVVPIQAQSCDEAAANATNLLNTALTLMGAGNTEGATTIITAARDSLADCTPGGGESAPAASTGSTTAPAAPAAAPVAATGIGDYSITTPDFDPDGSIAFVRFAHTSVDGGPIDLYYGRDNILVVSGLDYGEVTDIIPIQAGDHSFTARPAGSGADAERLYQLRWNFISNSTWTVTAAGLAENFSFIVEPISTVRNDYNGRARIRIVNLAAGAPRTTVTTTAGHQLADRLGWVGSKDTMLEPGQYTINASTTDGAALPEPLVFDFEANTTYTLMVTGRGSAEQPLTLLPIIAFEDVSRVRFINNRSDVVDILYRPGNEALVSTFDPQTETDWFTLPSGAVTFFAVAAGDGPTGRQLAGLPWQLRPARDVVVELNANGMHVLDVTLTGYGD